MDALEQTVTLLTDQKKQIGSWLENQWKNLTPVPYFSCDIRNASYKMGIVDTNLFPGGFNNLCNTYSKEVSLAFQKYFRTFYPKVKNIALIIEEHTRNKYYLMNVIKIQKFLQSAGLDCRITMPSERLTQDETDIKLDDDHMIKIYQAHVQNHKLSLGKNFTADIALSNNDFSSGVPEIFQNIEPVIPNPKLGWHARYKSDHFRILEEIISEFGKKFSFDPWLLYPITKRIEGVSPSNPEMLKNSVDEVIGEIHKKYAQYQITEEPYVFIKNDSGTYGLGLMSVVSGGEVMQLNRKARHKLFSSKANHQTEKFIIQEGIPSADTYSDFPIEPVIYGVGKDPIGGFFRIHEDKNRYESLNSPGMTFSCLCLHKLDEPHEADFINCQSKEDLIVVSRFLAQLAGLAAAKESALLAHM